MSKKTEFYDNVTVGVLCGGSGTRLWPLSTERVPKPFHKLSDKNHTLLNLTLKRALNLGRTTLLASYKHKDLVEKELDRVQDSLKKNQIVETFYEPISKNTFAPIALLALKSFLKNKRSKVIVLPSDHYIDDHDQFDASMRNMLNALEKVPLLLLGVKPSFADSSLGYILQDESIDKNFTKVARFVEKPNQVDADRLFKKRNVLWNTGIVGFRSKDFLDEVKTFFPGMHMKLFSIDPNCEKDIAEYYKSAPNLSVSRAILEYSSRQFCLKADKIIWSDIGTWERVSNLGDQSPLGIHEEINAKNCRNVKLLSFSRQEAKKKFTVIGISDVIVVETDTDVFITKEGESELVKEILSSNKDKKAA